MIEANILFILALSAVFVIACPIYYATFLKAIKDAVREHQGEKFLNGWVSVSVVAIAMVTFLALNPSYQSIANTFYGPALFVCGLVYIVFEIPYMLVKTAAKDVVEQIANAGNDKREEARLKSAQTLGMIMGKKLNVSCELQAFSSNEEFVFVTYIVGDKPIATRLKLNQADKAESWKKLGEWIMGNYQKAQ